MLITDIECCILLTEWEEELVRYCEKHPNMRIVDSMDAIRPIMSRLSMLAPFGDHGIHLKVQPMYRLGHLATFGKHTWNGFEPQFN